jgi:RimJ/RimL family protein N-acetyltransferase
MTSPLAYWHVTQNATNDEAYAILSQDPFWNCFALADLEAPFRDYCQFAIASQDESGEQAICLILRHPIIGQVLSPFGKEEGIAAILQQIALPKHPLIQAQEQHISLLQHYYQPETAWRSILRMAITPGSLQSPKHAPPQPIKQLTVADLPMLTELYAQHIDSRFPAELFTQGIFFGASKGGQIIAAGGTHVLTPKYGIAVLGHVLTAPEARGQGYATGITAALVETLFNQNFSLVVLNVFADNSNAFRVYQRLGFQTHYSFLTGKATLSR